MLIDYTVICVYLLGILGLGIWAGKGIRDLAEYSVVRRQYSSLVIFATLSASFIGGGFSFGNSSKVFLFGVGSIVALWGFSLKSLLVGTFIAPRMHEFSGCISVGDIMRTRYGRTGQVLSGILGVMVCAGITGAQVGAMGIVFHQFMGMDKSLGILIGCGIVIAYTTLGGMRAIVLTDVIQFIVLSIALPLALFLGIRQLGGIDALVQAVPPAHLTILGGQKSALALGSLFLSFLIGETLVPPYVQRLLIGKNSRETAEGTILSGLFSIPFFAVTGCIGLVALAMNPGLESNLSMPYVIKEVLPVGLRGIAVAGIISIVMSSADSFLNAASVTLINDVVAPLRKEKMSKRNGLLVARLTTLAVGIASVAFAMKIDNILDILLFAYNFWAPVMLVPLAAVLLGVKATQRTFAIGSISGVAALLIWRVILHDPWGIEGLVIGVAANLVAFSAIHRVDRLTRDP